MHSTQAPISACTLKLQTFFYSTFQGLCKTQGQENSMRFLSTFKFLPLESGIFSAELTAIPFFLQAICISQRMLRSLHLICRNFPFSKITPTLTYQKFHCWTHPTYHPNFSCNPYSSYFYLDNQPHRHSRQKYCW